MFINFYNEIKHRMLGDTSADLRGGCNLLDEVMPHWSMKKVNDSALQAMDGQINGFFFLFSRSSVTPTI